MFSRRIRATEVDTGGLYSSRGRNFGGRRKAACGCARKSGKRLQGVASDHRVHERETEQAVGGDGAKAEVDEWSQGGNSEERPPGRHGRRWKLSCWRQVKK